MTKLFWFHDFISKCLIYYTVDFSIPSLSGPAKKRKSGSSRKPAVKGVMYITKKKPLFGT